MGGDGTIRKEPDQEQMNHGSHDVHSFFGDLDEVREVDPGEMDEIQGPTGPLMRPKIMFAVTFCPKCGEIRRYKAERGDSGSYSMGMSESRFRKADPDCDKVRAERLVSEVMSR